jgi:hypothetical protein
MYVNNGNLAIKITNAGYDVLLWTRSYGPSAWTRLATYDTLSEALKRYYWEGGKP